MQPAYCFLIIYVVICAKPSFRLEVIRMKALDYVKIIAATFSVFFFGILLNLPQGIVVFSSIAALFVAVSLHVFHDFKTDTVFTI